MVDPATGFVPQLRSTASYLTGPLGVSGAAIVAVLRPEAFPKCASSNYTTVQTPTKSQSATYPRVGTLPALLVLALLGPLVELRPQALRPPRGEASLEVLVEDLVVGRLQLEHVAQLLEGGGDAGEGVGGTVLVEQGRRHHRRLVLQRPARPPVHPRHAPGHDLPVKYK